MIFNIIVGGINCLVTEAKYVGSQSNNDAMTCVLHS